MRQVLKIPMPLTSSYEMSAKSSFATYVFIIYPYRIWRISLLQGHLLLLHLL